MAESLIQVLNLAVYRRMVENVIHAAAQATGQLPFECHQEVLRVQTQLSLTADDHNEVLSRLSLTPAQFDILFSTTESKSVYEVDKATDIVSQAVNAALAKERTLQMDTYKKILTAYIQDSALTMSDLEELEQVRSTCGLGADDHVLALKDLGFSLEQFEALVDSFSDDPTRNFLSSVAGVPTGGGKSSAVAYTKLLERDRHMQKLLDDERKRYAKVSQQALSRLAMLEKMRKTNMNLQTDVQTAQRQLEEYKEASKKAVSRADMQQQLANQLAVKVQELELIVASQSGKMNALDTEKKQEAIRLRQNHNGEIEILRQQLRMSEEALGKELEQAVRAQQEIVSKFQTERKLMRMQYQEKVKENLALRKQLQGNKSVFEHRLQNAQQNEQMLEDRNMRVNELEMELQAVTAKLDAEKALRASMVESYAGWASAKAELEGSLRSERTAKKSLEADLAAVSRALKKVSIAAWTKVRGARRQLIQMFAVATELVDRFVVELDADVGGEGTRRRGEAELHTEQRLRMLKQEHFALEPILSMCSLTNTAVQEAASMFDAYRRHVLEWKARSREFLNRSMDLTSERKVMRDSLAHASQAIHAALEQEIDRGRQVAGLMGRAVQAESLTEEVRALRRRLADAEESLRRMKLQEKDLISANKALRELATPFSQSVPAFIYAAQSGSQPPEHLLASARAARASSASVVSGAGASSRGAGVPELLAPARGGGGGSARGLAGLLTHQHAFDGGSGESGSNGSNGSNGGMTSSRDAPMTRERMQALLLASVGPPRSADDAGTGGGNDDNTGSSAGVGVGAGAGAGAGGGSSPNFIYQARRPFTTDPSVASFITEQTSRGRALSPRPLKHTLGAIKAYGGVTAASASSTSLSRTIPYGADGGGAESAAGDAHDQTARSISSSRIKNEAWYVKASQGLGFRLPTALATSSSASGAGGRSDGDYYSARVRPSTQSQEPSSSSSLSLQGMDYGGRSPPLTAPAAGAASTSLYGQQSGRFKGYDANGGAVGSGGGRGGGSSSGRRVALARAGTSAASLSRNLPASSPSTSLGSATSSNIPSYMRPLASRSKNANGGNVGFTATTTPQTSRRSAASQSGSRSTEGSSREAFVMPASGPLDGADDDVDFDGDVVDRSRRAEAYPAPKQPAPAETSSTAAFSSSSNSSSSSSGTSAAGTFSRPSNVEGEDLVRQWTGTFPIFSIKRTATATAATAAPAAASSTSSSTSSSSSSSFSLPPVGSG